jgi:hypothetical protein
MFLSKLLMFAPYWLRQSRVCHTFELYFVRECEPGCHGCLEQNIESFVDSDSPLSYQICYEVAWKQ